MGRLGASMTSPRPSHRARLGATWDTFNSRIAPWIALVSGVATSLLWRAGVDGVRATFVLASLCATVTLLLLFPPWRAPDTPGVRSWLHGAAWWATVSSAQNALWFVIPFYVLSTTWLSRNAPFTVLLVTFGVLSCFDTFVRDRVLRRPVAAAVFVVPALVASLQLFLPVLTSASPRFTIFAAGAIAATSAASLVVPRAATRRTLASILVGVAILGALGGRAILPLLAPAPLRLASATFARGRTGLDPVDPIASLTIAATEPAYVFVSVEAPRGLVETVRLVVEDGDAGHVSRPLDVVGGRKSGYRLWAQARPMAPGKLRARVVTEGGQVVGQLVARVTAE